MCSVCVWLLFVTLTICWISVFSGLLVFDRVPSLVVWFGCERNPDELCAAVYI